MWEMRDAELVRWSQSNYNELMKSEGNDNGTLITLQEVMEKSEIFPIDFPIESVRCKTLTSSTPKCVLEENINFAYPVVHEKALVLYCDFLRHKRKFGTDIEKALYEDMTLTMFVNRLLTKRSVAFVGPHDKYMLMDGFARVGGWDQIGTPKEEEPATLKNCFSYDEIKLSALLSVSSYSQFINLGDRNNCGSVEHNKKKIEQRGVIVGLIGARFEKSGVMEYQDIVIAKDQNIPENGYGNTLVPTIKSIFLNFYGEVSLTYEQLKDQLEKSVIKFTPLRNERYFNNMVYERRLALSIDTFLIEANERARYAGSFAYLHVIGFGLGVWRISQHQNKIFMDTFAKRIEFLGPTLNYIQVICFSYMNQNFCGKYKHEDTIPLDHHEGHGIKIHIFNREPHEKLKTPYKGHLLIVSYAWDGNALPGNEFWLGQLAASGDPAAASSTQIAELHNPHINPAVNGKNLRVATTRGLYTLKEYQIIVKRQVHKDLQKNT